MEDNVTPVLIISKWCVMEKRMVKQQVQTPQGLVTVQQAINVPRIFRGQKEIQRYIEEQCKSANQINLQKIVYSEEDEGSREYFYDEEEESCH